VCCGSLFQSEILEGKKAVCCGSLLQSEILEGKKLESLEQQHQIETMMLDLYKHRNDNLIKLDHSLASVY
jgi:hypothetical protein